MNTSLKINDFERLFITDQRMVRTASLLEPLYEALKAHLLRQPAIKTDETTVQVLKEPRRGQEAAPYYTVW